MAALPELRPGGRGGGGRPPEAEHPLRPVHRPDLLLRPNHRHGAGHRRHALCMDTLIGPAAPELRKLQLRPADHPGRMRQRIRRPNRADTPADSGMELH